MKAIRYAVIAAIVVVVGFGAWTFLGKGDGPDDAGGNKAVTGDPAAAVNDLIKRSTDAEASGDMKGALSTGKDAYELAAKNFPGNSEVLAAARDRYAATLKNEGQYAQAEKLYKESLAYYELKSGSDGLMTATALNNLADVYLYEKRFSEALPLLERAVLIYRRAPQSRESAEAGIILLYNLATTYQYGGRLDEAEKISKDLVTLSNSFYGQGKVEASHSWLLLGTVYRDEGKYDMARPLYERTLEVRLAAAGPDDYLVAQARQSLGTLDFFEGKYTEARSQLEQACAVWKKTMGSNSQTTASCLSSLGKVYDAQGETDKSIEAFKEALEIDYNVFGPEHVETGLALNNLAAAYKSKGMYSEAEETYLKAVDVLQKAGGKDSPALVTVYENYAAMLLAQDRQVEAERYQGMADAIRSGQKAAEAPADETGNTAEKKQENK